MKKINLDKNEEDALGALILQGGNSVAVLKKIFTLAIEDLKDITNVDSKGNMGLQTLARQLAVEKMIIVRDLIFQEVQTKPFIEKEKPSQWK